MVIENFSPRVMDQFGLGADALLELNPRVVVVRMPAFGLTGPWRDRVGFAPTMEQIAGLAWVTGLPDGSARSRRAVPAIHSRARMRRSRRSPRWSSPIARAVASSSRCR